MPEEGGPGTLQVCSFLSGMNGDPIGGCLFDHVPFFKGEMSLAEKGRFEQDSIFAFSARMGKLREETGIAMMG